MRKSAVKNAHLDYIFKRVFIPASAMVTGQVAGSVTTSTVLTAQFGSGTPNLLAVGTSHVPAMQLAAVTDALDFIWTPSDFDNNHRLLIRYLWTSGYAGANGTATFTTLYHAHKAGDVPATGDTALPIVHGASTKVSATANAAYWSNYGVIGPLATGANANQCFDPQTIMLSFDVVCSAVTGITLASDHVLVLGAELVYTPRVLFGESTREARLLIDGLQANLEADPTRDI